MKKSMLVLLPLLAVSAAQAEDCLNSVYKLHDTLTSKSAINVTAAFSAVMLVGKLGHPELTKAMFAAYSKSADQNASVEAAQGAFMETQEACQKKSESCRSAILGFFNAVSDPTNRYGRAIAENELVKLMETSPLSAASRKNLAAEASLYAKTISAAFAPATAACK